MPADARRPRALDAMWVTFWCSLRWQVCPLLGCALMSPGMQKKRCVRVWGAGGDGGQQWLCQERQLVQGVDQTWVRVLALPLSLGIFRLIT